MTLPTKEVSPSRAESKDAHPADAVNAIEFLKELFAPADPSALVELRLLASGRAYPDAFSLDRLDVAVNGAVASQEMCLDAFFGVAPRARWPEGDYRGGGSAEVDQLVTLWADLDPGIEGVPVESLLERVARFQISPSALVASGRGVHAYFFLKSAWDVRSQEQRRRATGLLKRLAAALDADPAVADLGRVMRLPGTFNFKPLRDDPPGRPLPCRLLALDTERRYRLEDLEGALPLLREPTATRPHGVRRRDPFRSAVLSANPMASVARKLGLDVGGGSRPAVLCPFHADQHTKSLTLYEDHGHCFGCGWHGDAIALVRDLKGVGFGEALAQLSAWAKLPPPRSVRRIRKTWGGTSR